jgi:hypothetical protein
LIDRQTDRDVKPLFQGTNIERETKIKTFTHIASTHPSLFGARTLVTTRRAEHEF